MESAQSNSVQKFDDSKTEILKKRLLKSTNSSVVGNITHNNAQQNVLINSLRTPVSSGMLVTSVQGPQNSIPLTHNIVTHSLAPVKIHTNSGPYPLQLSTVHVPVQIPGSNSNINVPVQLSGPTSTVPLQITAPTVNLPLQGSGTTTNVPVQLPAGKTINVPLQLPAPNQNIQLTTPTLPSMPLLHNTTQPLHSSIIHVHVGNNSRGVNANMDNNADISISNPQLQLPDTSGPLPIKMPGNMANTSHVQMAPSSNIVQIPTSANNSSIQLQLPNSNATSSVQICGSARTVPHLVYIQTPSGLKPVTSTDVMSQASSSGNPPQIIVRKPVVTSATGIQLIPSVNTKTNLAPKVSVQNKSSILTPNSSQPIVIQKPKPNDKVVMPVSIAASNSAKQTIAYLGSVKKSNTTKIADQSILIPNNQLNSVNSASNQKLYLTPMGMPKKFILPVTLPASMSSKGPIINLQIANGQIQNDPQGNITVMRDVTTSDTNEMPPLQPLAKITPANNKECPATITAVPQSPKSDKSFALSIPGSRAESIGEQEYTLSIPETNASMNDDIYTVSIADDEGGQTREKSFTLAIPEKGKSLLNKTVIDRNDNTTTITIPAPAILRRSNSDNSDRKVLNTNLKRRISLCNENSHKTLKLSAPLKLPEKGQSDTGDHRVPSLFCDEKLDKELECKVHLGESNTENYNESNIDSVDLDKDDDSLQITYYSNVENDLRNDFLKIKREKCLDLAVEEDPPGLLWNNGIANLQGSTLQFQTNEFGLIDLIDGSDQEESFSLNPESKYNTPLKQRIHRTSKEKKPTSPEDLYSCDGCGCHGMAADFITPNFCSLACRNQVQKAIQIKKDREKAELNKKKNKMKKLLMRVERSNSESTSERKDEKSLLKQYDTPPNETRLTEAALMKMNEDNTENEKYPWMSGKNGFSWIKYLEFCKAKPAPIKLFKDPFPYNRNGFKVGMRMEAIDPSHPSMFCVVSVAETQGYRIRLHFDGFPDIYDYWINADSVDIFPPGWCEKNGRILKPPANYSAASFSWPLYLKQMKAVAAPKHLFPHLCASMMRPNGFRIGMKLEAEDRKNKLVCVATVADMLDNRILINFDSWDEIYDYWVDPTSPYIHPVGWAEENDIPLTPPNFYKDPDSFTWEKYLVDTGASAVPARAFKTRSPHEFRVGMKLEVVDPRVPFLIRVATISEVKGHQVRIAFDGWSDDFSFWADDDSHDIHPVGWCLKTYHPLEPPLTPEEAAAAGPCGVGGCRGLGSAVGGAHKAHAAATTCPYRAPPPAPRDRLQPCAAAPVAHALPRTKRVHGRATKPDASTPTSDTIKEKSTRGRPPKHKRVEEASKIELGSDEESVASSSSKRWRSDRGERPDRLEPQPDRNHKSDLGKIESAVLREYSPRAADRTLGPAPRLQHHIDALRLSAQPTTWTQNEVCLLITAVAGAAAGRAAATAQLSGADLLTASCDELVDCLKLRLGPAIKIYAAIRQLRQSCRT